MKRKIFIFILFFLIFISNSIFAYRPIYFNRAATLQQGNLTMRLYYIKTFFNSMYSEKENIMIDIPDNIKINFNAGNLFLSYGLFNRVTIGINTVYQYKELTNPLIAKKGSGLGDISNLIKFGIIRKKDFFLSEAIFVKWNNGKYEDLNKDELPLGTGTIDVSLKTLMDIKISKIWLYIIPTYTIAGKNDIENIGDSVSLVTTFSFPIILQKRFFGEVSFNGFYKFKDKDLNGNTIENSETYLISIAPAIQYGITKKLFIQTLGDIVITTKDSFGKSFILKTGISYKF